MRITTKGQVTIPKPVRDAAGINTTTELDVFYRDGVIVIEKTNGQEATVRRRQREVDDWLGRVKGTGDSGLSADDIMEMTRGPFNDIDHR